MSAYLVVLAVGLGSYAFRVSMLVLAARTGLPSVVERAARYAMPVSFAALATTAVANHVETSAALPPLAAVAVAVVAARRTGSARAAILAGMPTLWLLTATTS
jgi:branched-subunit amino acid transport protein